MTATSDGRPEPSASAGWPTAAEPLPHPESTVLAVVGLLDAAERALAAGDVTHAVALQLEALGQLGQRLPDLLDLELDPGRLDGADVARITGDLLDAVLGRPSTLLASYGSLRPGHELHHHVAHLGGSWTAAELRGEVVDVDGYPVLTCHPTGPPVPAMVLRSDALLGAWPTLDRVEGDGYRRAPVPAWVDGGVLVATCYVAAHS